VRAGDRPDRQHRRERKRQKSTEGKAHPVLTRRHFLIRVAPATVVPLLPILGPADVTANAAELLPFRVGEAAPASTFLAIWMAQAAGFGGGAAAARGTRR